MKFNNSLINRRQALKGLSGCISVPLLMPFVNRLEAELRGELPCRFLFVIKSSGLTPSELVPKNLIPEYIKPAEEKGWPNTLKQSERLIDLPLAGLDLPNSLEPLTPYKNQLTILQGLSGKMCRGGHSAWYGALGCYHTGNEGSPGRAASATIDGALANALPSIFPHVGLTLGGKVLSGVKDSMVYPGISALGPDRPLPYQANPEMAYKDLFGVAATGSKSKAEQSLQNVLLDHMVGDIKRLQRELGSAGREKLNYYLGAFESLQDRQRKLKGLEAEIRKSAPQINDKFSSEVETDRLESHFDIAAAALVSGITNVAAIRADTLDVTYRGLGISKHVHGLGHAESVNGMTSNEARNRIRRFHMQQIGRVAAKLKSVPEGEGTMLDNTLIVYLSDAAEKHHASCSEWPFLLLGGLGQSKVGAGRYLQFPSYGNKGHHTIGNLYNTFMQYVGKPQNQFGRLDLNIDAKLQMGPLSELIS